MPKFSVIVPIYKVEKFIKQCMQSILNQTFKDFEVICVDDCGKDNSMKIVEKMAEKDERIIILHHEQNRGLSAARNTGFEIAQGEYTLFVDSDDWLELNCLEVINKKIEANPDIDSIIFDAHKYSDNKHKIIKDAILNNTERLIDFNPVDLATGCDYAWIKAYRTSAIREKNLKFPEGLTFEDGEFFFKFYSLYPKALIIKDCLYFYREREGSIVTDAYKGKLKLEHIYQIIRNIREFFIEEGIYEEYKIALAILMRIRIANTKGIRYNHDKSISLSDRLLKDFGTAEEFRSLELSANSLVSAVFKISNDTDFVQSLSSLQNQNYMNLEIVCVYDNNESLKCDLEKIAKEDNRIKIVKSLVKESYKSGFENSTGRYVLFIDSADKIDQDYIKNAVQILSVEKTNFVLFKSSNVPCNAQSGRFLVDDSSLSLLPIDAHNFVFDKDFIIKKNLVTNNLFELGFNVFINSKYGYYIDKCYYHSEKKYDETVLEAIKSLHTTLLENNLSEKFNQGFKRMIFKNIFNMHQHSKPENSVLENMKNLINLIN